MPNSTKQALMAPHDAPTLILNPLSDQDFRRRALNLLAEARTPTDLQVALRAYYPNAVVRRRELDLERETWYVYREGHWIPSTKGE